jgi:hypothetical protein
VTWLRCAPLVLCLASACFQERHRALSAGPDTDRTPATGGDLDAAGDAAAAGDASTPGDTSAPGDAAAPGDSDTPPPHDTCASPLDVSSGGRFTLDVEGAHSDFSAALGPLLCGGIVSSDACQDVVVTFHLDEPRDVDIAAVPNSDVHVAIALAAACDAGGTTIDTSSSYSGIRHLHHLALPAGTYVVFIGVSPPDTIVIGAPRPTLATTIQLDVAFNPPSAPPANETCDTALDLGAGGHFEGRFVGATDDLAPCGLAGLGFTDLFYSLTLDASSNVQFSWNAETLVFVTLRTACVAGGLDDCSFLDWRLASGADRTFYGVAPGTYLVIIEDWGNFERDFSFDIVVTPAAPAPTGDICADPLLIEPNVPFSGSLAGLQDDITNCGVHHRDAFHAVTLTEESDVWISVEGTSSTSGVAIRPACDGAPSCNWGGGPPSLYVPGLAAGTYYVIVGDDQDDTYELMVSTSPASHVEPVTVSGNETCATAFVVPAAGGVFIGDTTQATDDSFPTACPALHSSADVTFEWTTETTRRVLVTTWGTSFSTTLELRSAGCDEMECTALNGGVGPAPYPAWSVIEAELPAGTYVFVLDSWLSSARGPYRFELKPL